MLMLLLSPSEPQQQHHHPAGWSSRQPLPIRPHGGSLILTRRLQEASPPSFHHG
ncbi:hypothetical protein INR49_022945 [Caranx melampygus]|nr:hypothetical protein INR49_022945 [Caranx melampygus]